MKTLRILHVAKFFPPDQGGMERFVHDLAGEQARRGHEVHVLAHTGAQPAGSVALAEGLTITRVGVWATLGGYAPVAPLLPVRMFSQAIRSRPDVVHIHAPNPAGLAAAFLPRRVPVLLHWHADAVFPPGFRGPGPSLRAWRFLEDKLLRRADAVVVTSPEYARTSPFLKNWEAKCRCVPLGLPEPSESADTFSLHPGWRAASFLQSHRAGSRILAVGRLAHYKGFSILVEALASLPGAVLCLIGDGEEREALGRCIEELGLKERCLLAGQVDNAERDACFRLCDMFCLPSITRAEAFGLSLLEAMQCGKPCVVTDVPGSGMTHAVSQGENGLVCPPGDAPALARSLGALLNDPAARHSMGRAGRERFARLFSLRNVCREMESVYSELTVRHG
ncbi:MAG: glycosyltransferase [Desulfovibrionaceae bacterium]|nr:glycosyltransferase [Desulfovibrionaceae bacterium]